MKQKRMVAALLFPLLLAASAAAEENDREGEEWGSAGPFPAGGMLVIRNERGTIRVVGEPGRETFDLRAVKTARGVEEATAARVLEETAIIVREEEDERLRVEVRFPEETYRSNRSFFQRLFRIGEPVLIEVDLEIFVPDRVDVEIHSGSADVEVNEIRGEIVLAGESGELHVEGGNGVVHATGATSDMAINNFVGDVAVQSSGGEIEVRRVYGTLSARGTSGSIYCYNISGAAKVRTISGYVLVEECLENLEVEGGSGSVDIIRCSGGIDVRTGSGDVSIHLERLGPVDYFFETLSGDLDLVAFGDLNGLFDAATGTGSIQCFLPVEIKEITNRSLRAIAGVGGATVQLRTGSGTIRISRTD